MSRLPGPGPVLAALIAAYLAVLLALDTQVGINGQRALGLLTWVALVLALLAFPPERRAFALGVIVFATLGEITGSLILGVYTYRLENLPLFIPPGHGLVYLAGLCIALWLAPRERWLVALAFGGAIAWGIAGLTVMPRLDVAGALGVPLFCLFLWRSSSRAVYAGVFLVVAALEFYGTAIGTWQWAKTTPVIPLPDGNPPSGVASGYVWFDVMAVLLAPFILVAGRRLRALGRPAAVEPAG